VKIKKTGGSMLKIREIELDNNVCLAPMAGIGNNAYRRIIKEMGAGLIYTEMVSDKAVSFGNEKTLNLLQTSECERPISQQIFGKDKETMVEAAKFIEKTMKPEIIDINMGCPVPKIAIKSQAGAALMKNPELIKEIVTSVVEAVSVPVTVKLRSGWDENSINVVEVAKICEEAGASAIAVHPRTRKQGYAGLSNWDHIKAVKEVVNVPVIGNGDIKTPEDAKRMIDETGCDGVMIGRAALGNPWFIRDVVHYLETGELLDPPSAEEKIDMIKKHLNYLLEIKPEKVALLEMRSHSSWYLKGIPGNAHYRQAIMKCDSINEFLAVIDKISEEIK